MDIAFDIGSDDVERLEADSNVNVVRGASSTMNHIVINSVNFDTLKNPQVRQAMHMALDMDAIVAVAFKGYATVAESLSQQHHRVCQGWAHRLRPGRGQGADCAVRL